MNLNWVLAEHGMFQKGTAPALKPQSFPSVKVRILRPFYGLRRLLNTGEVVALAEPDAENAVALGRAERV